MASALYQRTVDREVAECLRDEGPWNCFVSLVDRDASVPVTAGPSRTARLSKLTVPSTVIGFCTLPRKVDCADSLLGHGFDVDAIGAALAAGKDS